MKKQLVKKAAFIPLAAFMLVAAAVACNKMNPPAPGTKPGMSVHKEIPTAWATLAGRGKYCISGPGTCAISNMYPARVMQPNEVMTAGDITPDGQLVMTLDLSTLDPAVVNELITNKTWELSSDVVVPQEGLDALCDAQTPAVPHWTGPVTMPEGTYTVTITNAGADQKLVILGTHDSSTDTWSWQMTMH